MCGPRNWYHMLIYTLLVDSAKPFFFCKQSWKKNFQLKYSNFFAMLRGHPLEILRAYRRWYNDSSIFCFIFFKILAFFGSFVFLVLFHFWGRTLYHFTFRGKNRSQGTPNTVPAVLLVSNMIIRLANLVIPRNILKVFARNGEPGNAIVCFPLDC